jgi:hypothetical protein
MAAVRLFIDRAKAVKDNFNPSDENLHAIAQICSYLNGCSSTDMNSSQILVTLGFLVVATTLEVSGDAVVRMAIYNYVGFQRGALMLALGMPLLLGYGISLNLAPVEFRQVVGLYIATLFVVWQIINFAFFRTLPNLQIVVGGTLIVVDGLIVTFWKSGTPSE